MTDREIGLFVLLIAIIVMQAGFKIWDIWSSR